MLTGPDNGNFKFLALPTVVAPETVTAVLHNLPLRGWQIADRWALGCPATVREMEKKGTLIPRLKKQQKLEAAIISDARIAGRMSDVPDSEILAMHEIAPLPARLVKADRATFTERTEAPPQTATPPQILRFPANTPRKFSPGGLKRIDGMMKDNPLMALSHVPDRVTGEPVFDPELSDAVHGRFPWNNATPTEKQAAIDAAWSDPPDH